MSQLETFAQHRDEILLAEIGAWLHMLGKYDWRFIEHHCNGKIDYDYQNFISELSSQYLKQMLDPSSNTYKDILPKLPITAPESVGVFIRDHRKTKKARQDQLDQLTMLLVDAHGRGSNIDKSEIKADFPQQTIPSVYLSTAFGFDHQLSPSENYRTDALHRELEKLATQLQVLKQAQDIDWKDLVCKLRQQLISHFRLSLAETRRPFNDVTLLDQTASSVAFFKSALAERILAGNWKPLVSGSSNQYHWRTLTLPFAGLNYLKSGVDVLDLLSRRKCVLQAQNAVQTLLEITYPIGQEIYRDERICIFLVPDDANLLRWQTADGQTLEILIQQTIARATQGELYPNLQRSLLSQGTRTIYTVGQEIKNLSQETVTPDATQIAEDWEGVEDREICTNCRIRPQGASKNAIMRKICDVCLNRRGERAKGWTNRKLDRTIWLDEVADINGSLALLVGSWNLKHWLDGTLINTINATPTITFTQLEEDCRKSLKTTKKGHPQQFHGLLSKLLDSNVRQQFCNKFRPYFETIVQPEWKHLLETGLPEETIAAMHFVRQNPSFSRLRRVWETTQQFWEEINKEIIPNSVKRRLRLEFTGSFSPLNGKSLQNYQACELVINDYRFPVFCQSKSDDIQHFLTIDNLDYALKRTNMASIENFKQLLEQGEYNLEISSEYGTQHYKIGLLKQINVELETEYTPCTPLLSEPCTFMVLVPADKIIDIIRVIKTKYEREMGKVLNRLPLHLGAIYARRRTPLRAILDAGRRMLQQKPLGAEHTWRVQADTKKSLAKNTQQFQQTVTVQLAQDEHALTWYVPVFMGDGETEDNWYPYVFIETNDDDSKIKNRRLVFRGLRPTDKGQVPCWLVHANELREGDQVYFTPATFDFEWLDTSGRRFEIAYDEQGRRYGRTTRPYLLDDLDTIQQTWKLISEGLVKNQIHTLRDTIETKREAWLPTSEDKASKTSTFWRFCHDVIVNANWKTRPCAHELNWLADCAVGGLLADVVELYMGVMKEKPQRNNVQE